MNSIWMKIIFPLCNQRIQAFFDSNLSLNENFSLLLPLLSFSYREEKLIFIDGIRNLMLDGDTKLKDLSEDYYYCLRVY